MNCLRSLGRWNRGFETHSRHGCLVCVCVYSVFVLSSVWVAALWRDDHSSKESYGLRKMITELNKRPGPWMGWKSPWKKTFYLLIRWIAYFSDSINRKKTDATKLIFSNEQLWNSCKNKRDVLWLILLLFTLPKILNSHADPSLLKQRIFYCHLSTIGINFKGLKHNRPLWVAVQGLIRPTPYTTLRGLLQVLLWHYPEDSDKNSEESGNW
jgi:hypothetical protein